ncbi:MAG: noncanonical pyrimidine nucleotidase, YjjG family [Lachnospiraceae bacterium]|jgi:2-haloacid dehalogenase|nr:noncanonical pyrimidine nucleotidase, YjjG family [Lachnospiraceae bacterium]
MKRYEVLLFDVDGTLLDFELAERQGIEGLLTRFKVPVTEENRQRYHALNKRYWQRLEQGEITREQVLSLRFEEFFGAFGIRVDGMEVDGLYRESLNNSAELIRGASALLEALKPKYELYIVTNGVAATQHKRLRASGLERYFRGIFISEEAGADKPSKEFFEYVFAGMGRRDTERMLIIGDSLTSDIRGGNNMAVDTLWYNPHGQENTAGVQVDYEARSLEEVGRLLL